eukprot:CAMPEP_0197027710 /NCGR_PEP_ID=MMETSP1384-20130603/7585_1 /TAXON_ID=29189 /ORGANISM="Ammonia sp." /LENGTH=245 /DNA_ID=CAMNT_0042456601 /DNA_START=56 /DNA_END=793 /DNA_ORIENTATION=+
MTSYEEEDFSDTASDVDKTNNAADDEPEEDQDIDLEKTKTNEAVKADVVKHDEEVAGDDDNKANDEQAEEEQAANSEKEKTKNKSKSKQESLGKKRKRSEKEEEDGNEADDDEEKPAIKKRKRGRKKKEEQDLYEVEEILGWRYIKGDCVYHVKWKGYALESATWEPIENVAENEKFQEFVRKVQLQLVEHDESGLIDAISEYDPIKLKEHFTEKYWHGDDMDKLALQQIFKFTAKQDPQLKLHQ